MKAKNSPHQGPGPGQGPWAWRLVRHREGSFLCEVAIFVYILVCIGMLLVRVLSDKGNPLQGGFVDQKSGSTMFRSP